MICKNCGQILNDGDLFCGNCGAKVEPDNNDMSLDNANIENAEHKEKNSVESAESNNGFDPYSFVEDGSVNNDENEDNSKNESNIQNVNEIYTPQVSSVNIYNNKPNAVKTIRFNKKAAIIILVVIVVLVVGITAGYFIWNSMPVKIDMADYISSSVYNDSARQEYYDENGYEGTDYNLDVYDDYNYYEGDYSDDYYEGDSESNHENESPYYNYDIGPGLFVYGYNEYASISEYELQNVIDWESLENDLNAKLSKKKRVGGRHLTFNDIVSSDSFSFTVDKFENLKNDDVVTVTVSPFTLNFDGVKVEFNGCSQNYTISDLQVVNAFDPFEYVNLVLYGANGYAYAKCVVDSDLNQNIEGIDGFKVTYFDDSTIAVEKDGYIVSKINFYLNNDQEDSYFKNGDIVTMYCYSSSDDLIESYSIYIANYQKDVTVSGLGEYITKSSTISSEDLEKFKSSASTIINNYYGTYDSYSGYKFNSAYIADLKDKSDNDYFHNDLCLIYSYTYTSWNNETETRYMYVMFENVIMSPDGTIAFTPEDYYDSINSSYESPEEIISSKFDDGYNVSNIN